MHNDTVSLVVLCCNQLAYTQQTIDSILRFTRHPYELIVVDNGSTDGTSEWLRSVSPESDHLSRYHVIINTENHGVAAGLNQALRAAQGAFICHLNNDIIVTDGWLSGLVSCARRDGRIGIVGCCTNPVKNPQGGFPACEGYADPQQVQRTAALLSLKNAGMTEPARIVHGFCMLITRQVLERVGTFDESYYPMNGEDVDLCFRTLAAGFLIVNALDVFVFHFYNTTAVSAELRARHGSPAHRELKARQRFLEKWGLEGRRYIEDIERTAAAEKDRIRRQVPLGPACEPA